MHHGKGAGRIVFIVLALTIAIFCFAWRAKLAALLPVSAQNFLKSGFVAGARAFRETFGINSAGGGESGLREEIVLDDGGGFGSVNASDSGTDGANIVSAAESFTPAAYIPVVAEEKIPAPDKNASAAAAKAPAASVTPAASTENSSPPLSASPAPPPAAENIPASATSSCAFPPSRPASSSLPRKILFNEIAWMGSPSSSVTDAADAGKKEWMELKNISGGNVDLAGWEIANASGKMKIDFGAQDAIAPVGFFLLVRGSTTFPYSHVPQRNYSGDLRNGGEDLVIFDPSCGVSDFIYASSSGGWIAGDNTKKTTMERDADGGGWHTSANRGGTPGAENSVIVPPARHKVTVAFQGNAGAAITSDPKGMECTVSQCSGTYIEGTTLALTEKPPAGGIFDGWSGACSGKTKCSFTVGGDMYLGAAFHMPVANPVPAELPPSAASSSEATARTGKLLIAAVQIAGASSTNDFVMLYNPGSYAIDVGGWKLRKKSQTGSDYSLREIPAGATADPGRYFTWANSAGGFSEAIGADVSSAETLAGNNSIALIDADGIVVDALAWGTGTDQYGEGPPYPVNPAAAQGLVRNIVDGVMVDTGNNADDFAVK